MIHMNAKGGLAMNALFLYGANCTLDVWNNLREEFRDINCDFVEYQHDITMHATSVEDLTKWVYQTYREKNYDYIVGHSIGGIIGLELVAKYKISCKKLILIESNLRPAKEFYRNLMTPDNMTVYGEQVLSMIHNEAPYYNDCLKYSLQDKFDYTDYVKEIDCEIYGIYGDRGQRDYYKRIEELCLSPDLNEKIIYRFIEDSCHMPMIENPIRLSNIIKECMKSQAEITNAEVIMRQEIHAEELREVLIQEGASIVGFADLSHFAEGNLKHGISIALKLPANVVSGIEYGPTREYYDTYYAWNDKLNRLAKLSESYIKEKGYYAIAQTTDVVKEYGNYRTPMPHKTVATNAGVGWIGKCALLVTKEYGSAIRITSVLTDAPLTYGVPMKESLCGNCMRCTRACPGQAISGANWNIDMDRDLFFDPIKCRKSARELAKERINKEITLCGKCIQVCPYTNRYLRTANDITEYQNR